MVRQGARRALRLWDSSGRRRSRPIWRDLGLSLIHISMEEADVLYGVTMQERGVSKLLELKVTEIASKMGDLESQP